MATFGHGIRMGETVFSTFVINQSIKKKKPLLNAHYVSGKLRNKLSIQGVHSQVETVPSIIEG